MKERQEPSAFDNFEQFKEIKANNRLAAYENKVCLKLINRLFESGSDEYTYWKKKLTASSTPLADLQEALHPFKLYSHRPQTWNIHDLFKTAGKLMQIPLWQEFAQVVDDCAHKHKGSIPGMLFYNSVLAEDMIMHVGSHLTPPNGYMRLMRTSSSGEGTVVVDTLDGFIEMIGSQT